MVLRLMSNMLDRKIDHLKDEAGSVSSQKHLPGVPVRLRVPMQSLFQAKNNLEVVGGPCSGPLLGLRSNDQEVTTPSDLTINSCVFVGFPGCST